MAELYDAGLRVPGTSMRIGLDPLIGLVPGLGDLVGAGVALWVVYGFLKSDYVIVTANVVSLAALLGILYFKLREIFGRSAGRQPA